MRQVILNVPDISCEHCEHTVISTLSPVEGVERVQVDIPGKQVEVTYDESKVDVDRMEALLEEEEYPVESARVLP